MSGCRTSLSLLTLNLWHDSPPLERRGVQRQLIETLSPDVIAFQEVLREGDRCQAEELLAGLAYEVAYGEVVPFWKRDGVLYGNAIASRSPIGRRRNVSLPQGESSEKRAALLVELIHPAGGVRIACTHLHHRAPDTRSLQLRAALDAFEDFCQGEPSPRFFLGDLNSSPGKECTPLLSQGFVDMFERYGEGEGLTWSTANPYAVVSEPPGVRIDYIWAGRELGIESAHCEVVGTRAKERVFASDHFGVFARIEVIVPRPTAPGDADTNRS